MSGEWDDERAGGGLDLDGGETVLLLSPTNAPAGEERCVDLLTVAEPDRENLLLVTVTGSADDRLDAWRLHAGERLPRRTAVLSVGESTRSAAVGGGGESHLPGTGVSVETVSNPGDLTGVGMRLSERLRTWADSDGRTVVCFHSIDPLLQYVDLSRLFRFLHVLTGRLRTIGAVAHFHLDPSAHDPQTVDTLLHLFDAAVEVDEDGRTTVRGG
jgi:hypothetical protein